MVSNHNKHLLVRIVIKSLTDKVTVTTALMQYEKLVSGV